MAFEFLKDAEKLALKQNNTLELAWIACDQKYWRKSSMPIIRIDTVQYSYEDVNSLSREEWANMMYSLPQF